MTVLITGARGFLGRHLSRRLAGSGDSLVLLDQDPRVEDFRKLGDNVVTVVGSILDKNHLIEVLERHRVDGIFHLAYTLGTANGRYIPMIEVNSVGTANVFEAARVAGVPRVVYVSSVFVYPLRRTLSGPLLRENDLPSPQTIYGACKLLNEQVAARYAELFGLQIVGLRLASVFGPGRSRRRGLDADFLAAPEVALSGGPVVMPPEDQIADWIYVLDAAEACVLAYRAGTAGHRVFNVSAERCRAGEVTQFLRKLLPEADIREDDQPHELGSLMNTDRVRSELSFVPRYSVKEGMLDYLEWLKSEPDASS